MSHFAATACDEHDSMKIAVYTIAKNEAKQVRAYMDSCREADLVVITDTGSSDDTPDLLRQEVLSNVVFQEGELSGVL